VGEQIAAFFKTLTSPITRRSTLFFRGNNACLQIRKSGGLRNERAFQRIALELDGPSDATRWS